MSSFPLHNIVTVWTSSVPSRRGGDGVLSSTQVESLWFGCERCGDIRLQIICVQGFDTRLQVQGSKDTRVYAVTRHTHCIYMPRVYMHVYCIYKHAHIALP